MSELPEPRPAKEALGIIDAIELPTAYDPWKRDLKWHAITIASMVVVIAVAFASVIIF